MGTCKFNLEKDFEYFVRNIGKLEAVEFCGLAKILGVSMYKKEELEKINIKELKEMDAAAQQNLMESVSAPMDEILEKMMDRFLELPRKRRKEINKILKDVKRGK
jgi:hypothetical protein